MRKYYKYIIEKNERLFWAKHHYSFYSLNFQLGKKYLNILFYTVNYCIMDLNILANFNVAMQIKSFYNKCSKKKNNKKSQQEINLISFNPHITLLKLIIFRGEQKNSVVWSFSVWHLIVFIMLIFRFDYIVN